MAVVYVMGSIAGGPGAVTVTYGGQAMTELAGGSADNVTPFCKVFYKVGPLSGTQTVTSTHANAVVNGGMMCQTFTGTPTIPDGIQIEAASKSVSTLTVTGTTTRDQTSEGIVGTGKTAFTPNNSQTEDMDILTTNASADTSIGGYHLTGAATNTTLGITNSLAGAIAIVHVAIRIPGNALVIGDGAHAHTADNLTLTAHEPNYDLVIQDATHAHAADNLALVQHNVLVIQDAVHAHTADNLTLTAHAPATPLVIQDAIHAHTANNLVLTQHNVLTIQDGTHAHTADNLDLTQHNILVTQDAAHSHTADNVTLTQHHVLVTQEASHAHLADNITLTQHNILVVQDGLHGHTADNVTLTAYGPGGTPLVIQDGHHVHTADNLALTQHNVLAIQDGLHSHFADKLVLGIPVLMQPATAAERAAHQEWEELYPSGFDAVRRRALKMLKR
jgi:hypothetical protein